VVDTNDQAHWDKAWDDRDPGGTSWYQLVPTMSLALIDIVAPGPDAGIVDVGGGASYLVDHLIARGHRDVTVVDFAVGALAHAQSRMADRPDVHWVVADATTWRPDRTFDLWHDRAVFHFLTDQEQRASYIRTATQSIVSGGHLIIGTFALDGPTMCSGLPVQQYDGASLAEEFDAGFRLIHSAVDGHVTPGGATQQFTFVVLRRR
jgi:SAM-dependent methyltransferase